MKSCSTCRERKSCTRVCAAVEKRIPGEFAGSDPRREVSMDPSGMEVAVEKYSFCLWMGAERGSGYEADLSVLTRKEKQALVLIASGLSQRAAAKRLGIHLKSLQSRIRSARGKLHPRQNARPVRDDNGRRGGEGA